MAEYDLAVIGGDGVGPEVNEQAVTWIEDQMKEIE